MDRKKKDGRSWTGFVRIRIQTRFVPKLPYSKFYMIYNVC